MVSLLGVNMKVLELCSGREGWSKIWARNGHEITAIDNKDYGIHYGRFIKTDLLDWEPDQYYDVILASPPCSEFTQMKKHNGNADERYGLDLVYRCFYLISKIKPKYFLIENVKGLSQFLGNPNQKIRYGKSNKWAYLWTNIPELGFFQFDFSDYKKDELYHGKVSSWKIWQTGERAEIPETLSNSVYNACCTTVEKEGSLK